MEIIYKIGPIIWKLLKIGPIIVRDPVHHKLIDSKTVLIILVNNIQANTNVTRKFVRH